MKKFFFISIIFPLLFIQILFAKDGSAILKGHIDDYTADSIILGCEPDIYKTMPDSNGDFILKLETNYCDFFDFTYKGIKTTLLFNPGDTLVMNFKYKDFEGSIEYVGKNAIQNKKLLSLSQGKAAPNFGFTDISGKKVSLSDFKGKYVYIDVWNSNCGPCRKEFPFSEKLMEEFNDRNIVFVGISFDSDKNKWLKTIKKNQLKGIQLFGGGWKSDFAENYLVNCNPRFILIDKEQRIIFLSAPRPSKGINKILQKLNGI
jgi:thiol-disulfide isomerase/thioredoxin